MSRDQIINIAMVVCVVVLLCAVIITSTGMFGGSGIGGYADAEKYTSGDTDITDEIRNLDIHWTAGKVTVAYRAGSGVTLRETAKRQLSDDEKLQWWVDGDTLRVQFTKPGIRWNMPEKELTITLPEGIELKQAGIHTTSGDIEIPAMKVEELLVLDSTSGDIRAAAEARNAEINATSGAQTIQLSGEADIVRINSTSGDISAEAGKAAIFEVASTSGGISMKAAECGEAKANSTSGKILVDLGKLEKLNIGATSGDVTVKLPEEPGFTAGVHTTSGEFTCGIALTRDSDRYVCGDGSAQVNIDTTSGSVHLEATEK